MPWRRGCDGCANECVIRATAGQCGASSPFAYEETKYVMYSSAASGASAWGISIKRRWINNVDQRSMFVQSASQETMASELLSASF